MFWKRKPAPAPEVPEPQPVPRVNPLALSDDWREDSVNGRSVATFAKARGRYEIAEKHMRLHNDWYEINVVKGKKMPGETAEDRARYRDYLDQFRAEADALPLAVADRTAILALLSENPGGITRAQLEGLYKLTSTTKLGVMLNQLERGGWITREGEGKKQVLKLETSELESEADFEKRAVNSL